jgi:hypothetical protein
VGDEVGRDSAWADVMSELASAGRGGAGYYIDEKAPYPLEGVLSDLFFHHEPGPCTLLVDWGEVPGEPGITKGCGLMSVYVTFDGMTEDVKLPARVLRTECGEEEGWFWDGLETMPNPVHWSPMSRPKIEKNKVVSSSEYTS